MITSTSTLSASMYSSISASTSTVKNNASEKASGTKSTESVLKTGSYGKTIGDVKLSDTAAKYYEELKKKYSDMDFVLVSDNETDDVEQKAAGFGESDKTMVLIDASRIEEMAANDDVRKQYEDIIGNAKSSLDELQEKLESSGTEVQAFGIRVNDDGTTSFFAVLKKSSEAQKERIEKKAEEKKAEEKKAEKKSKKEDTKKAASDSKVETIKASSIDDLLKKISDSKMAERSDQVRTEAELQVGQNFDFRG